MPVPTDHHEGQGQEEPKECCSCWGLFGKKAKEEEAAPRHVSFKEPVPFSSELPKDLCVGKTICVTGLVRSNCSRFAVNLTCGKGSSADIAFHFNPRLDQRYVVRNSRLGGYWGKEETSMTIKLGIVRNRKFELSICIGDGEFLVGVDGAHFCAYKFRTPVAKITSIDVTGCVDVHGVACKDLRNFPEVTPKTKPPPAAAGPIARVQEDEAVLKKTAKETPAAFLLPRGFQQGWQLEIYGRIKMLPHSFYVNLQEGSQQWPHPTIPLHLNPRFITGPHSEPTFVRNSWIDGQWGQEERTPGFRFSPGSPFLLAIRRNQEHFSVFVDDKLCGEFKFRRSCDKIDTVLIQGDVVVYRVAMDERPNARM